MKASTLGALSLSVAAAATTFFYSMTAHAQDYQDGETVEVSAFDEFTLTNGAVTIRRGETYSVKIIEGADTLRIRQDGGELTVGCIERCPRGARHELEVTTDRLTSIAIKGGGWIGVEDDFPEVGNLDVTITGGGAIEAYSVPGRNVDASIMGGGELQVNAIETLDASIMGGGSIDYIGNPSVDKSILGGGSISKR